MSPERTEPLPPSEVLVAHQALALGVRLSPKDAAHALVGARMLAECAAKLRRAFGDEAEP
ncbi:MAG: hypothetical protein DI629_06670 [Mesorhizobium amorphae]|nr:MAG: hypothetical protein DI629_06670 [Mesorhizobium amorphae]